MSIVSPPSSNGWNIPLKVADATFLKILFGFIQQCGYEYIWNTLFCLEFAVWMYLGDDWKLACIEAELM
jgi:hypothetical protein